MIRAGKRTTWGNWHVRALVTGGAGFIGSHLTDRLISEGHEVTVLDDLSSGDPANLASALATGRCHVVSVDVTSPAAAAAVKAARPELVFHLAAQIDVRVSVADPLRDAHANILGTVNILEAARAGGAGKFLLASIGGHLRAAGAVAGDRTDADQPVLPLCGQQTDRGVLPAAVPQPARPGRHHACADQHVRAAAEPARRGGRDRDLYRRHAERGAHHALRGRRQHPRLPVRRRRGGRVRARGERKPYPRAAGHRRPAGQRRHRGRHHRPGTAPDHRGGDRRDQRATVGAGPPGRPAAPWWWTPPTPARCSAGARRTSLAQGIAATVAAMDPTAAVQPTAAVHPTAEW